MVAISIKNQPQPLVSATHLAPYLVPSVDYLGWFSLMSTLEESPVENFSSTKVWVMEPSFFYV
jgi:hypothetical protein